MKYLNLRLREVLSTTLLVTTLGGSVTTLADQSAGVNEPTQPLTCASLYFGCNSYDKTGDNVRCPSYRAGINISAKPLTMSVSSKIYDESSATFVSKVRDYQAKVASKDSVGQIAGNAARNVGEYTGLTALSALYNPMAALTLVVAGPYMLVTAPFDHHRKTTWQARAVVGEVLWEADLHLSDGPGVQAVTRQVQKQLPSVTSSQVAELLAQQDAIEGSLCGLTHKKHDGYPIVKTVFKVKNVRELSQLVIAQLSKPVAH